MSVLFIVIFFSTGCKENPEKEWDSRYVVANDIKLHYTRTGYNKPLLIALHGITDNGLCWEKVARNLNDRYDMLMPDARGHGLSEAPAWGYDPDTYLQDVVEMIKKLNIRKPVILGHSLGAVTTAMLAANYPNIPRAIILEDPVGLDTVQAKPDSSFYERKRAEIERWYQMSTGDLIQACRNEIHPDWPDYRDYQLWAQAKQQVDTSVVKLYGMLPSLADYFPDITCPVLILKADSDEQQKEYQKSLFARISNCQVIYVTGAGHNIRREQYEAFQQALRKFLDNL